MLASPGMSLACARHMLVSISKHAETESNRATDARLAKRRAKVRSAWISFAGRIVAQILGAAATVGFALIVLQHEQPSQTSAAAASMGAAAEISAGAPIAGGRMVAVLPFHTYAATPDYDHMAGAITDLIVTELAQTRDFKVTSATSAMRYQGASATVPEIGRQLGASHIVEGSVAVAGGRARVIAQLIETASDQHMWARSYETTLDDPLSLERRVAEAIAEDVRGVLAADPR